MKKVFITILVSSFLLTPVVPAANAQTETAQVQTIKVVKSGNHTGVFNK